MAQWEALVEDLKRVGIDVGSDIPAKELIELGWNKDDALINEHIQNVFDRPLQEPLFGRDVA